MPVPPQSFLKRKEPYRICNNLHKQIIKKLGPTINADLINKEEELLKKKSRYNLRSLDLDQIKFLVDDNQYIVIEEEEEEKEQEQEVSASASASAPIDPPPTTPTPTTNHRSKPRKGSSVTFPGLIAVLKKRHEKQFKKLTMRGRVDKARYILADLLAMSVAPDAADNLNCFGSTYLINNKKELAQDVLAILEQVKMQLELQLKVDLKKN